MAGSHGEIKPAVLLCGHGSRNPEAATEFRYLVEQVQKKLEPQAVSGAFLQFNQPTIPDGLQAIYDQGGREIIVQPVTLYNASHTKIDIPEILAEFTQSHPDVRGHYGASLGLSALTLDAAVFSIQSVMPDADLGDCKLLLVGRGSKDRTVADQTINLCRKLHDRMDFGDSRYCYPSESSPILETALAQAARSHYPHVIILPFLLFSGRLLTEIHDKLDVAAEKYPAVTFYKASHLGPQDEIADAVIEKINLAFR